MIENKKVISWSLVFLFLSLSIVYSLTYMKKTSLFRNVGRSGIDSEIQSGIDNENQRLENQNPVNLSGLTGDLLATGNVSGVVDLGDLYQTSGVTNSINQIFDFTGQSASVVPSSVNMKVLSGTTEYFGVLDIVGILGKKPKFTLQDSRGNYFAYYGERLDFVDTIQALGGNVYEMVTENEILQNQLFGDRVSYINLSMFRDIRVLMIVEIDDDVRLLQIPADQYHYSKDYLKSLFIQ